MRSTAGVAKQRGSASNNVDSGCQNGLTGKTIAEQLVEPEQAGLPDQVQRLVQGGGYLPVVDLLVG